MKEFSLDLGTVAAVGTELTGLAATVTAATPGIVITEADLLPVYGVVGGEYLAELLAALTASGVSMTSLATFFQAAGAATGATAAASVSADVGAAVTIAS